MSATQAQIQFAGEFALFLVASAGVAFVLTRPDLVVRQVLERVSFGVGSAALAVGAFLHGASFVEDGSAGLLRGFRVIGVLLLARAIMGWGGSAESRVIYGLGLAALLVAEVVNGASESAAEIVRIGAAVGLGLGLVQISGRSIAARVAAGSTAIVFGVVLAVAVALSAILADTTEDEALRRTREQATAQAASIAAQNESALITTGVIERALSGETLQRAITVLADDLTSESATDAAGIVKLALDTADTFLARRPGPTGYVTQGVMVAATDSAIDSDALRQRIAGSALVGSAISDKREVVGVVSLDGKAFVLAAQPIEVVTDTVERVVGAAVGGVLIDENFLGVQAGNTPGTSLAIVGPEGVIASHGDQPDDEQSSAIVADALANDAQATSRDGGRFSVAAPIPGSELVLVASVPSDSIEGTRTDLFRTLFIVALVASLVALAVAALLGRRIGLGVRRLTTAAERMGSGDLAAEAEVVSDDELGVLATTFNLMATSLAKLTGNLRAAAAEEARLRNRVEAVIDGMGEGLVAIDSSGTITDLNGAALALFGVSHADAVGQPLPDLGVFEDDAGADISAGMLDEIFEPSTMHANLRCVDDPSTPIPLAVTAGPLVDEEGTPVGSVFVLRDMRQEREIEKMKTEFIANIGHELRTPLTPIKAYSGMLLSRDLPGDRVKMFAGEIRTGADQLERVVVQLINFATIAAGRLDLETEDISPSDVLAAAAARWADRLADGQSIAVDVDETAPDFVGDRSYVDQSLDELIDNAAKYSPDNGDIELTARYAERGGRGRIEISVRDHGVGIEPDRLDDIIGDFTQGDGSATRQFGGLGLGLSLVNHIMTAHENSLKIDTTFGEGSTFTMTFDPASGGVKP